MIFDDLLLFGIECFLLRPAVNPSMGSNGLKRSAQHRTADPESNSDLMIPSNRDVTALGDALKFAKLRN
jgi:hypothetical protein